MALTCQDDGQDCTIDCGFNGCHGANIQCVDGYQCIVNLNHAFAAYEATINGNGATKLDIITTDGYEWQLLGVDINCGNAECTIHCASGQDVCMFLNIRAESAPSVLVTCDNSQYTNTCDYSCC